MDKEATAGACSDCELGPQAVSRKAGYGGLRTWAEERELPLAELKERAWNMAAAGTSELSAAPAGSSESRRTFP